MTSKNFGNNYAGSRHWQQLAELVTGNNPEPMLKLLQHQPILAQSCNEKGCTLLVHACFNGKTRIVEALLKSKANPNRGAGWLPLTAAAKNHNYGREMIELLISNRADPNPPKTSENSPLIVAAAHGNQSSVQALLRGGADAKRTNRSGSTALIWACKNGCAAIVQDLIEAKADVHARDHRGFCPLFASAWNRKCEGRIIDLLVANGVNVNVVKKGRSPMQNAVVHGNHNVVESLLHNSAKVDIRCSDYRTPLMSACRVGSVRMVRQLLDAGANPTLIDDKKRNAFWYARNNELNAEITPLPECARLRFLLKKCYALEKKRNNFAPLGFHQHKKKTLSPWSLSRTFCVSCRLTKNTQSLELSNKYNRILVFQALFLLLPLISNPQAVPKISSLNIRGVTTPRY